MIDEVRPGTLKLVTASPLERIASAIMLEELTRLAGPNDIRRFGEDTLLLHTAASVAEIRDRLVPHLGPGESLFVAEFERWSSYGEAADRTWLLRRGH